MASSLCYRCEHRACFLEKGHGPRCECQEPSRAVCSCYMYMPVIPVITEANKGDKRPIAAGWMISAREHPVEVPAGFEWKRCLTLAGKTGKETAVVRTWKLVKARLKKKK